MNAVLVSRLNLWLHRKTMIVIHQPPVPRKSELLATKKAKRPAPRTIAFFDLP
jgi:hypothetical protein